MAKSKQKKSSKRTRRDYPQIANRRLLARANPRHFLDRHLQLYEDRRLWHPLGALAPARSYSRTRHALRTVPQPNRNSTRAQPQKLRSISFMPRETIAFANPDRVLICARRQRRKQVLHAKKKVGRGASRRRPKFNFYSSISCRRK